MTEVKKLTPKMRRFVAEFCVCMNATEAARRAGYSARTAYAISWRLLNHPAVSAAIAEEEARRLEELRVTADRLDAELARIGFASGAELERMNCTGRDKVAALKLLLERHALLEPRLHLAASPGVVFYLPDNGRDSLDVDG